MTLLRKGLSIVASVPDVELAVCFRTNQSECEQ
jgi:hypothetical protein